MMTNTTKPSVLFVSDGGVSGEIRAKLPARQLISLGYDVQVMDAQTTAVISKDYDVIIFSRPSYPNAMEEIRKRYGSKLIVDIDDDFSAIPPDHPGYKSIGPGNKEYLNNHHHCMSLADLVTFSTRILSARLGHICKKYTVIPNDWSKKDPWKLTGKRGKESSTNETLLRYTAMFGYYSEGVTRFITALSAREVMGDTPESRDYAQYLINETMFNMADWNTSRMVGKMGAFGPASKLMFSFQRYNQELLAKLYREMAQATKNPEARTFLKAHLAAQTVIAGTLGLSFASLFAWAISHAAEIFGDDDEPYDAAAAWRTFLAKTYGADVGAALSEGILPAVTGVALQSRAGEQDLFPFTRFITDRRKWSDALDDWAVHLAGSPMSAAKNIMDGADALFKEDDVVKASKLGVSKSLAGYRQRVRDY